MQDKIDISTLTNNSFDTNNCASAHCCHHFCLCIGLSSTEIRKNNEDKRDGHREEMTKWHTASVSHRGPKPKMPKMMSQQLACMCSRMHCLDRVDGKGCFVCELACKNAKSAGRDDRPYFDKNWNCTCPVCNCNCSVVYFCHNSCDLPKQTQKEVEERMDTKQQTKIDAFCALKSEIYRKVKGRFNEMN